MQNFIIMKNKRFLTVLAIVAAILLIPFIGMQLSDEVNWSTFDFAIMGGLLLTVSLLIDLVVRKFKTTNHRYLLIACIVVVFFLTWAELAVGIFGTPLAGN